MSTDPEQREPHAEQFEEGEESAPRFVRAMSIVRWLLVLAMATAAALSIWHVYGQPEQVEGAGATQYFCPMHPAVVQDHPGDCPICNMSLVPREASHATGHDTKAPALIQPVPGVVPVQLPEQRIQLIGMRTAKVRRAALPSEIQAVGYVAPTESGLALVQTRFSGWIEELLVSQTGQQVQRGQLLARVFSPELLSAQQELLNARQWTDPAPAANTSPAVHPGLANSARIRLALMGMEPSEIAEVERTGVVHRLVEVRSPARGYVAEKSAVQGLYIQPGSRLFDIADLSRVWVFVELSEHDAGRVQAGQTARLQLTAYPGETFSGKVQLVYPTLNMETRSQRARIELKNGDLRLRPGMLGSVVIQYGAAEGLVVATEAVVDTGEQQYVFVVEGGGRFVPRSVQLGARSRDQVQVLSGLVEGETVVTTGNFLIDSESRLRFASEGKPAEPTR
jgi:membrane fusion protein, copper/silver efflux system